MFNLENPEVTEEEEKRKTSDGDQTEKRFRSWKPTGVPSDILTVDCPAGYKQRWVVDYPPGNVTRRLRQGYEFVIDENLEVGDPKSIDGHRVPGNVVCKYGNPRHRDLQYLMRIPEELHAELVKQNQSAVDDIDKQLYRKKGEVDNEGQYVAPESKREFGLARHNKE